MKILITGASRGIGQAAAKALESPDNQLFLAATSKASFSKLSPQAKTFAVDLSKPDELHSFADELKQQTKTLDVLVNNVGVMRMSKFETMSETDISYLLDLNLRAHLLLTRSLLSLLLESDNPQIIFMSSMAAKSRIVGESVYAATKSAITAFAGVLRNELTGRAKVTAVHAYGVNTWDDEHPEKLLQPQDIAQVMQFIVTRPASVVVESIDLSNIHQWRGGEAPWSPR